MVEDSEGDDSIFPGFGDDTIHAGPGSDHVSYAGPNSNGTGHKPVLSDFPYLAAPN